MKILVLGGTRMMGRHLVQALLSRGHQVTLANRGLTEDSFGGAVDRVKLDRTNEDSLRKELSGKAFDLVYDSLAYCSNDVRRLLPQLSCRKYLSISSTAVYEKHWDTREPEFDPLAKPVIWGDRADFPYDEGKRQAERALVQEYSRQPTVAVRFPFVVGEDDYTRRLLFYVEHTITGKAMLLDNLCKPMAFVRSDEAGKFLAFLGETEFQGAINGASPGAISLREILEYVTEKTGKNPVLAESGDPAPYNGETGYTINTGLAGKLGFSFSPLREWIYPLLDHLIEAVYRD